MTCRKDHDFAIEHKAGLRQIRQGGYEFGEISAEGLSSFGLQQYFFSAAEGETAKTIPLRFVQPACATRNLVHRLSFGRRIRRLDWKLNRREGLNQFFRGSSACLNPSPSCLFLRSLIFRNRFLVAKFWGWAR